MGNGFIRRKYETIFVSAAIFYLWLRFCNISQLNFFPLAFVFIHKWKIKTAKPLTLALNCNFVHKTFSIPVVYEPEMVPFL